jgi:TM2 domain-containing membrane protein YozV
VRRHFCSFFSLVVSSMDKPKPEESKLHRFYRERLVIPVIYWVFLAFALLITFAMTWAGWRGKFQPWGDPISLTEALSKTPPIAVTLIVVWFVFFGLLRMRF